MHIVYLHQYFAPLDGTGGTRSYEMARRLVRAGHTVTLVTAGAAFPDHYDISGYRSKLCIDGIKLVVLNVPYSNKMSYLQRILAFFKFAVGACLEAFRTTKVDVVFATSTPLTIAFPAVFWKLVHRVPMVFEVRDLWPELPIAIGALSSKSTILAARWLERWAYRNAARVVALSPGMAEGVERCGYPSDRVVIIPNSCDVDLFRVPDSEGEGFLSRYPQLAVGPLIVYTGTLGRINGVSYLARIAAEMLKLNPSMRFLIVGDGMEWLQVEEEAKRLGVFQKNLWMIKSLAKEEMPQVLSAATLATSLFVNLPEMWNNSANKFFDALAAGLPIAINYEGWQAEVLRTHNAGIVIPAENAGVAATVLNDFVTGEQQLLNAGQAASDVAESLFSRDKLAEQFIATLETVGQGARNGL